MGRELTREAAGGAQTAERALALLQAFTDEHPERRIAELVQATGLGQSTVSRLIGALESLGFVTQDPRSGLYRLGHAVVTLSGVALNQSAVHQHARQVAQDFAHELGLGSNVAERHGDTLHYLCHFEGRLAPRSFTMVGRSGPLHATAIGKALLFDLNRDEVLDLLGTGYTSYTPKTITDADELLAALEHGRSRGYTTEVEELAFGRACIAAPIRDRSGWVVAALSVSGPLSALDLPNQQDLLATKVIEYADLVSTGLGYHATTARQPTLA